MAKIDFGGTVEEVITRDEFSLEKARDVLKDEVITVLGYGVQGPAQALNMRDNGFKVIIGQSKPSSKSKRRPRKERSFNTSFPTRVRRSYGRCSNHV
jgi:ketol-acid reductoisomerase